VAERVVVDERDREPDEVAADDNAGEARLAERLRDGDCDRRHGRKDVEDVRRPVGEEDERVVRELGADHPGEGPQGERVPKPPRTPSDVREGRNGSEDHDRVERSLEVRDRPGLGDVTVDQDVLVDLEVGHLDAVRQPLPGWALDI